jgi:hypothetical protein
MRFRLSYALLGIILAVSVTFIWWIAGHWPTSGGVAPP